MSKKTPVDEFIDYQTKEAAERAQRDLNMWQQWDQGGRTAEGLSPLKQQYAGLLNRKVKEWKAPAVNPEAFRAELDKHFILAAQSFDPNKGSFNTHVQNRLRKSMRFNAKYQNVGYIPEDKARHIGRIQVAQNELEEELGRKATSAEIGQRIDLPTSKVTNVVKAMRMDVPASRFEDDPTGLSSSRENDVIRLMSKRPEEYFEPDEAKVFKHIYGFGAPKIHSTKELAATLGTSQSRISRLKTSIGEKVKKNL